MPEFEKSKKSLKTFLLVLGIIQVVAFVLTLVQGEIDALTIIFNLIYIGLYTVGYLSASKGEKLAGTIGIVMSCILMATILILDIIDFAIGIFLCIEANKYNKAFKNKDQVSSPQTPNATVVSEVPPQTPQVEQPVKPENPNQNYKPL